MGTQNIAIIGGKDDLSLDPSKVWSVVSDEETNLAVIVRKFSNRERVCATRGPVIHGRLFLVPFKCPLLYAVAYTSVTIYYVYLVGLYIQDSYRTD